jgi:hypothetical protein
MRRLTAGVSAVALLILPMAAIAYVSRGVPVEKQQMTPGITRAEIVYDQAAEAQLLDKINKRKPFSRGDITALKRA